MAADGRSRLEGVYQRQSVDGGSREGEFGLVVEVLREQDDAVATWSAGVGAAEAEMRPFAVYRFNAEGKVIKRQAFTTPEEALEAL
jgi:hypothetical protein